MEEIRVDLDAGVSAWFEDYLADIEHTLARHADFDDYCRALEKED